MKRTWTRNGDEYISNMGEVIRKCKQRECYLAASQNVRSHVITYYCSPQIDGKKFNTLKESKQAFEEV